MPTRYLALPCPSAPALTDAGHDWQHVAPTTCVVVDPERKPISTGVLDQHGTTIYRVDEPAPMGFRSRK